MKKLTKIMATTLAMCSLLTVFASAAFTDEAKIDLSNKYAVNRLVDYKIISGNPDGSFSPDKAVTRAEMAKMISVMTDGQTSKPTEVQFTDINGHWAKTYILDCVSKGIIAGKSATSFAPDEKVTGVEASKMLLMALGMDAKTAGLVGAEWATNATNYGKQFGLTNDIDENITDPLTKENAAQMISNALSSKKAVKTDSGSYSPEGKYLADEFSLKATQTNMPKYIYDEMVKQGIVSPRMWGQTNQIEEFYGIEDKVEYAHLSITPMSPGIDEVFITKVKDGKMKDVEKALEERLVYLKEQKAWYPADHDAADMAKIYKQGDYIMLFVSGAEENYSKAQTLFKSLAK